jgi:hypothetical protein
LANHTVIVGPAGRVTGGWAFRRNGKAASIRVEGRFILNATDAATAAASRDLVSCRRVSSACSLSWRQGAWFACSPIGKWGPPTSTSSFPQDGRRSLRRERFRILWRQNFVSCRPHAIGVSALQKQWCPASLARQCSHAGAVEVIVMIVRDRHDIDVRQVP